MSQPQYIHSIMLTIVTDKPIPELTDLVADRAFRMDNIRDATATLVGTIVRDGERSWTQVPYPARAGA